MKLHVNLQFCYMNKVPMKVVENQERNTGKKIYFIFYMGIIGKYSENYQIFGIFFLQKSLKKKVLCNS